MYSNNRGYWPSSHLQHQSQTPVGAALTIVLPDIDLFPEKTALHVHLISAQSQRLRPACIVHTVQYIVQWDFRHHELSRLMSDYCMFVH